MTLFAAQRFRILISVTRRLIQARDAALIAAPTHPILSPPPEPGDESSPSKAISIPHRNRVLEAVFATPHRAIRRNPPLPRHRRASQLLAIGAASAHRTQHRLARLPLLRIRQKHRRQHATEFCPNPPPFICWDSPLAPASPPTPPPISLPRPPALSSASPSPPCAQPHPATYRQSSRRCCPTSGKPTAPSPTSPFLC